MNSNTNKLPCLFLRLSILATAVFLLNGAGPANADEPASITGEFGITYHSKYIWRGVDFYDDEGGVNPQIFLDLFGTGFYIGSWSMIPFEDKSRNFQEFDYYGGYYTSLFEDSNYQTDLDISYTYFDFPLGGKPVDFQEVALRLSWPSLMSNDLVSVVPQALISYAWPAVAGNQEGWWIIPGLNTDLTISETAVTQNGQTLNLLLEAAYTEQGTYSFTDRGFVGLTSNLSTSWTYWGISFTPGLHYAWNWDSSSNPENEFWVDFATSYAF